MAHTGKRPQRAFAYRAGVRVEGTILACDASAGSELIFLSQAGALGARAARALPRARHGRRQILTTETTLALLGAPGERLRAHALLAGLGRPFVLGELRLELFSSGHAPGAASLACERPSGADARPTRVVYAGVVGPEETPAVRLADALCLDATFGARRSHFRPSARRSPRCAGSWWRGLSQGAATRLRRARRRARVGGRGRGDAQRGGRHRAGRPGDRADGDGVRPGRPPDGAGPAFRRPPPPGRGAALAARDARARRRSLGRPRVLDDDPRLGPLRRRRAAEIARARADHGVPLTDRAGFSDLLRYVATTGAREVALTRAPGDELLRALAERGVDAYPLGPPHQIALFPSSPEIVAHVVSAG